ncbi:MAG: CoA transferase, partial [Actinobacteria bacterium]|nr:CoA transferase [Actinomycetota bacterium]
MSGPLAGLRVVDFGQYIAGPLAAVLLAEQGADVIHVDPPGGPRLAGVPDAFYNRGKRRVILDLKTSDGQAAARKLAATADVVIENFRPGVMARLGLDLTALRTECPALITCSLPGFAADDPRAALRAFEGIVDAATANCEPRNGEEPPGWDWTRPTYSALPLASHFAGYLAALSIVMALIARRRTGAGQAVEVPLFDAMFTLVGHSGAYAGPAGPHAPAPIHGRGAGAFRCADGRYVQFDTSAPRHLAWFASAAGVLDSFEPELLDVSANTAPEVNARLHERLRELFVTRTAAEWEEIGGSAGAAIGFIRTPAEWLATEHAQATGASAEVIDPELGPIRFTGLPVRLAAFPDNKPTARRLPGADTDAVLAELGQLTPRQVPAGSEPDLAQPLSGMKVIDTGVALAGPTCGRMLAEFGAEVIKIYPPTGGSGGFLNRGKQSLLADLSTVGGQGIYWRLIDSADVVVENFSPGTADRLGI